MKNDVDNYHREIDVYKRNVCICEKEVKRDAIFNLHEKKTYFCFVQTNVYCIPIYEERAQSKKILNEQIIVPFSKCSLHVIAREIRIIISILHAISARQRCTVFSNHK